jgi:hypothetical protein
MNCLDDGRVTMNEAEFARRVGISRVHSLEAP